MLASVVAHLNEQNPIDPQPQVNVETQLAGAAPHVDFADIRGQEAAKRATTIAAAGAHNLLMIGPQGTERH